jgi:hypothetical protein
MACESYHAAHWEDFLAFENWFAAAMNGGLRAKLHQLMKSPRIELLDIWHQQLSVLERKVRRQCQLRPSVLLIICFHLFFKK